MNNTKTRNSVLIITGLAIVVLLLLLMLKMNREYQKYGIHMGTTTSVTVYAPNDIYIKEIEDLIDALDKKLSWREERSLTSSVNKGEKVTDEKYIDWIKKSLEISEKTGGAFDITLRPLIDLWGIETVSPKVPKENEIEETLKTTGYENIMISENGLSGGGRLFDLGAVGKGIALDEIKDYLDDNSVSAACVSIGGSVITYEQKSDKSPWTIGINNPFDPSRSLYASLYLDGTHFVSTSGDYEKYFEKDGVIYHHIFDGTTGYPAKSGLRSVTVICDNGLVSDALSTACFIVGYDKSLSLLKQYDAHAVFITDDGKMLTTEGFPYKLDKLE